MANAEKYAHTWHLGNNSLWVRWYRYTYYNNPLLAEEQLHLRGEVNFCLLFWGTVLSPLMWLLFGMLMLMGLILDSLAKVCGPAYQRRHAAKELKPKEKPWPVKVLYAFTDSLYKLVGFVNTHPRAIFTALIAAVAGGLSYLGYYCSNHLDGFLNTLAMIGIGLGVAIGLIAIIVGCAFVEDRWEVFSNLFDWLSDMPGSRVTGVFRAIGRGFSFLGRVFATAYYSTKYRYCPRVIIEE